MAEKRKKKEEEKLGWQKSVLLIRPRYAVSAFDRDAAVSAGVPHYCGIRRKYADDVAGRGLPAPAEQHVLPYPSAGGHRRHQQGVLRQRQALVKRVIATEGQTVDIDFETGEVSVDGTVLQEDYINALTTVDGGVHFPLTVAEGCIFVLGDNRGISEDSRYPDVGQIDKREVLGKAIFLMYPGTDDGTYPREFDRVGAIQ